MLTARVHQGCRLLLDTGRPAQALSLLRASSFLILDEPLPDGDIARRLLVGLIERTNTDTALSALPLVAPCFRTYRAAFRAFAAKRSVRGVNELLQTARTQQLLQVIASRWLAGTAGTPG